MTTADTATDTPATIPSETTEAPRLRSTSNVEILILTHNEERNLPHALRSVVEWADAVHIVDSGSTDSTPKLAREAGANFVHRPWLGYAQQKNWALEHLPIRTEWVFILDADESITPALRDELLAIARRDASGVNESGFYVNRLTYFMGKPIRHCGYFPSYNLRFFKRGRAQYESREVHEHMIVDGPTGRLRHIMLHEDRRGLEHFIAKHNRYSTLEARALVREQRQAVKQEVPDLERGLAFRRWLKRRVLPIAPFPWLWRFIYMYFVKLGFLDGRAGLRFSLFLATYDLFIGLKLAEARAAAAPDADAGVRSIAGLAQPEGALGESGATPPPSPAPAAREIPRIPAPVPVKAPEGKPPEGRAPQARAHEEAPRPRVIPVRSPRRRGKGWRQFTSADAAGVQTLPISVIILTYNEELNIADCIESCAWSDDVHVLDSGSTDRTREIVEATGIPLWTNRFQSFGQQRNWAIDNIPTRHKWQFQLDADERFTPELIEELRQLLGSGESRDKVACYRCPSKLMFMDRWVRHAAQYPVYQVRLIDKTRCRFEDYGHGQREVVDGPTGVLRTPYLHHNFSKGVDEWIQKHNSYSTLEAYLAEEHRSSDVTGEIRSLFSSDPVRRRRAMKMLGYRLPGRAWLTLAYIMVIRAGFLDGSSGYNYARLRTLYESMISLKLAMLRHNRRQDAADPER